MKLVVNEREIDPLRPELISRVLSDGDVVQVCTRMADRGKMLFFAVQHCRKNAAMICAEQDGELWHDSIMFQNATTEPIVDILLGIGCSGEEADKLPLHMQRSLVENMITKVEFFPNAIEAFIGGMETTGHRVDTSPAFNNFRYSNSVLKAQIAIERGYNVIDAKSAHLALRYMAGGASKSFRTDREKPASWIVPAAMNAIAVLAVMSAIQMRSVNLRAGLQHGMKLAKKRSTNLHLYFENSVLPHLEHELAVSHSVLRQTGEGGGEHE